MANPLAQDGITQVRVGTGAAHCFFCDTLIEKEWPCVERIWQHAGGAYSRNGGAKKGVCPVGKVPEYAHVQCAWQLDTRGGQQDCAKCGKPTEPCRRVVNYIASREKRCSQTSPLIWCFGCAGAFVAQHRNSLNGWLGAEQMRQGVAWVDRPLFPPPGLQAGCGLPPMTASARDEFASIFRSSSAELEALAVERHRTLQAAIVDAFRADKARASRQRPQKAATPVERKARRMRLDSRSDERRRPSRSRSPRSARRMQVE